MAKRLQASDEEVALLILVDPRIQATPNLSWLRVQAGLTAHKVRTGDYSWKLVHKERRQEVMSGVRRALGRPAVPNADPSRREFDLRMVSIRAECVPSNYRGAVAIFASIDYALREWFWAPYFDDLGEDRRAAITGTRRFSAHPASTTLPPPCAELSRGRIRVET